MKRTIAFAVFCLVALFLSQIYGLYQLYTDFVEKKEIEVKELLLSALDNEIGIRVADRPKNPHALSYTIKYAEEMTPEERVSLKGDTINLDEAIQKNWGHGISEIFAQAVQDQLAANRPIRLSMVDSLYQIQLERNHIPPLFRLRLYDKDKQLSEEINHDYQVVHTSLLTGLLPIGMRGTQFIEAEVVLPPYALFRHLTGAVIVSILICLLFAFCIYRQLLALRNSRNQLEEQQQTVYGAVHDLKKPLNRVFAILDFLQHSHTDGNLPISSFLKESKQQIRRLTDMIECLLGNLREGDKPMQINWKKADLPALIKTLYQETQMRYPQKIVVFHLDNPDNVICIDMDCVRLERCLQNLLENAFLYSDEQVVITIRIKRKPDHCVLTVSDTGWGISPKALKRLGECFYRYHHPGKTLQPGYGIGLNSIRRLVKEMGGNLSIESQEGKGSSFHLILPIITTNIQ